MMSDIVKRLRAEADKRRSGNRFDSLEYEAADEINRLRKLVQDLIDNDPDEIISDAGHSVLDLWRHEACKALGPLVKGGGDASLR